MIIIEPYKGKSVDERRVEVVERKGKGHPDTICDSIMDNISVALCKEYMKEFGSILHHNIDKGLLSAGCTTKQFGGGRVRKPMELIIGDRATVRVGRKKIPAGDIAIDTAKTWIRKNLRFVDPEKSVRYRVVFSEGSEELTDIFARSGDMRVANDTSAAIGYYPLSPLETTVISFEKYLNSKEFKNKFPETGEDIKVMGIRKERNLYLTVAMPLLSPFIKSEADYFDRKENIRDDMMKFAARYRNYNFKDLQINYNTLDEKGRGIGGVYLSLQGTSAEDADSGQVGRGNRVNGLISINRPMGTEAAAGKNPVSHVGKIYNVFSHKAAEKIFRALKGVKEVYVMLVSQIGAPIDRPQMATVQLVIEKGTKMKDLTEISEDILRKELKDINTLCLELAHGRHPVC